MFIVTGANGFIGSAFVTELNNMGHSDLLLVDMVTPAERPELLRKRRYSEFMHADTFLTSLEKIHAKTPISWLVHMGACSSTLELNEAYLQRVNLEYTQALWTFCTQKRIPFIYASSGSIYGDGHKGFDDADDPSRFEALNPYGWSKLRFDRWALNQTSTPPAWFGLRFFNVFGPNEYHKGEMSSVVFKAFQQIRETGKLKLFKSYNSQYEDGKQLRDFVYVRDITRWMSELTKTKKTSGIYNMGMGTARTWLDLAQATFSAMNKPMQISWIDMAPDMRPRYQYFTQAKMDRLFALGISAPQWPLEKAVTDYVQGFLQKEDPIL